MEETLLEIGRLYVQRDQLDEATEVFCQSLEHARQLKASFPGRPSYERKFDESLEIAVNLGVDPRHADQNVRGVVALPNGTGKTVRVAVFAKDAKADEAKAAGAERAETTSAAANRILCFIVDASGLREDAIPAPGRQCGPVQAAPRYWTRSHLPRQSRG